MSLAKQSEMDFTAWHCGAPYAGAVGPGTLLVLDNAQPHVARAWWQFLKDIIQFSFSYIGRNHNSSHLKSFYRMKELMP